MRTSLYYNGKSDSPDYGAAVPDNARIEPGSRRQVAIDRRLDPARERAEERVSAFLQAAFEVLDSTDTEGFTLQAVVERSGQSLRAFYQHFAGKHELLLAVFEEGLRATADQVAREVDRRTDPLERLHAFVSEYHRLCLEGTVPGREKRLPSRAMAHFAQELLLEHPNEAARAFTPLVTLLSGLLADAARAGAIRDDVDGDVAGHLLQVVMFDAFGSTIAGASSSGAAPSATRLWDLLFHGLEPPAA